MDKAKLARVLIYLAGLIATGLSLAQFGSFDWETMTFDLYPFRVDDAVKALISGGGNALAVGALLWQSRKKAVKNV